MKRVMETDVSAPMTSMLDHFACLAASATETSTAIIGMVGRRNASPETRMKFGVSRQIAGLTAMFHEIFGHFSTLTVLSDMRDDGLLSGNELVTGPLQFRFMACLPLISPGGQHIGFICVLDAAVRDGLTQSQTASLNHIANLITADRRREQRHTHLMHVVDRALRADRILRLISDAASCAAGLTSLLEELCHFHGAAVGRIWQMTLHNGVLQEVSRYSENTLKPPSLDAEPAELVTLNRLMTADAIRRNLPGAVIYSKLRQPEHVALLEAALAAGLASQVSVPIRVQQQRFGISLAFTTERLDLEAVMADIASLANTIRPALFRKVTEEHIRFVAHHDNLTQLANRLVFHERLEKAVTKAFQGEHGLALLYLDLDGFKLVNDTRGHDVGDKLLAALASRLRENVRDGDTIARMGGDEFAIVQPLSGQPSAATALAQRLLEAVRLPFDIDGQRSSVGVSIGIAIYPGDGDTPDLLLRNADAALYCAKHAGRNMYQLFDPSMTNPPPPLIIEQDLDVTAAHEQAI
jgi:diguanylate cyclase (GGDEF)-like protein